MYRQIDVDIASFLLKARSNTDTEISDLKQNLKVLDEEHSALKTKFGLKNDEYDVLKQQLSISETGLQSLQEDLLSLNNQLTEVLVCVYAYMCTCMCDCVHV